MALLPLPDIYYDGDFDQPIEIEGSGMISTDNVTNGLIITRKFVIKATSYVRLPLATKDPVYRDAFLVDESSDSRVGPLLYFTRVFFQLPKMRMVPRTVAFTVLGKSAAEISTVSHQPIGWNQYGAAAPNTRNVNAQSIFTYSFDPNTFSPPPLTRNTYLGSPVDFMGEVYQYQGQVRVNTELTEPRWRIAGATFYTLLPALWIQEVNVTQYRGALWQMEVVQVLPYSI